MQAALAAARTQSEMDPGMQAAPALAVAVQMTAASEPIAAQELEALVARKPDHLAQLLVTAA